MRTRKPSCVSFHSNIIIKTISLRKIIPRNFFFWGAHSVCLCCLFRPLFTILIYNYTIFFLLWGYQFFFRASMKASEKKPLAPDWKMMIPILALCIELNWCAGSRREHLLSVTNAINILTPSALSDLVWISIDNEVFCVRVYDPFLSSFGNLWCFIA